MTINELLWLDSTGHTSLTSRVQLSLFCPSGAFQRRRIMPACYCCLALIVFIWSFFLDFCASSMDEQFEWLNCFLVDCFVWFLLPFLTSLSYISQVDTGSFILKLIGWSMTFLCLTSFWLHLLCAASRGFCPLPSKIDLQHIVCGAVRKDTSCTSTCILVHLAEPRALSRAAPAAVLWPKCDARHARLNLGLKWLQI